MIIKWTFNKAFKKYTYDAFKKCYLKSICSVLLENILKEMSNPLACLYEESAGVSFSKALGWGHVTGMPSHTSHFQPIVLS